MEAGSSACVALAFLVNYNTLKAGFVYDDSRAIVNNPDVTRAAPLTDIWTNDFWGTPIGSSSSHGSYRPLCVASFRLNHWTGGLDPKGYHVANVLLHCAVTYLVYAVYRTLMPGRRPAAAAAGQRRRRQRLYDVVIVHKTTDVCGVRDSRIVDFHP